jgi:hypothetical protein
MWATTHADADSCGKVVDVNRGAVTAGVGEAAGLRFERRVGSRLGYFGVLRA